MRETLPTGNVSGSTKARPVPVAEERCPPGRGELGQLADRIGRIRGALPEYPLEVAGIDCLQHPVDDGLVGLVPDGVAGPDDAGAWDVMPAPRNTIRTRR
jgi:hypothetical protein